MKIKDRNLVEKFVEKAKNIPNIECIILFGSIARNEEDKRSDLDLLLVFDEENPKSHIPEIMRIVTTLKPHREIKPTITNLTDLDEEFLQTVLREGEVLWGKIILAPNKLLLKPYRLITYDISAFKPSKKVKISRLIHGYRSKKTIEGKTKEYSYSGLKDKYNVYLISKNTVLIPEEHSKNFLHDLDKNHVPYKEKLVWI
jgi:predicted nucleotidyltransferase